MKINLIKIIKKKEKQVIVITRLLMKTRILVVKTNHFLRLNRVKVWTLTLKMNNRYKTNNQVS
jgi:hypothetical protein